MLLACSRIFIDRSKDFLTVDDDDNDDHDDDVADNITSARC